MKNYLHLLIVAAATLGASASYLSGQTVSFLPSDGDWALSSNWSSDSIPGSGETALVNQGRIATVSSAISQVPQIIRIGNNANDATLNVTAGSLTGNNVQVATGGDSLGSINLSGGTLTTNGSTFLASNATSSGATASLTLTGGTLDWGTNLNLGTVGSATITVDGTGGTSYSGTHIVAENGGLRFLFGESGVNSLDASSSLTISSSSTLTVNGSAYTGNGGIYPLIKFGAGGRSGDFSGRTAITNFEPFEASIKYNNAEATVELVLIPDPRSFRPKVRREGDVLILSIQTVAGVNYRLSGSRNLTSWTPLNSFEGDGSLAELVHPIGSDDRYFLRVEIPREAPPEVPWDLEALSAMDPEIEETDEYQIEGFRSLFYQGVEWQGEPTRVYAYVRSPEGVPPEGGWPAVVLVHGGGGTAFYQWVKRWNDRGFAAISMDLEGRLPDLSVPFNERPRFEGSGPVRVGVWGDIDLEPVDQWFYHAVAQVMLAKNVLAQIPEIDPDNIGIMGVSWGGIITCVAAGLNDQFRFAIPVYGCGFLVGSDAQIGKTLGNYSPARIERILALWEPSRYLPSVSIPILFVNGSNDTHFPIDAWQRSADAVPGPVWQSAQIGLAHGHVPPQLLDEPYVFAQAIVDNSPDSLPQLQEPVVGDSGVSSERNAVLLATANLAYTADTGDYINRSWIQHSATITGETLSASLPEEATGWFFETTTAEGLLFTSPYREPGDL